MCGPARGRVPGGAAGVGHSAPGSFPCCLALLRAPGGAPVRQLPVPVRWAAVTAVTIAASTGCMSIGSDGGKPAPSGSAVPKGAVAEPDGSTVAGTGHARTGAAPGRIPSAGRAGQPARAPPSPLRAAPVPSPAGPAPRRRAARSTQTPSAPGPGVPEQPEPPASVRPGPRHAREPAAADPAAARSGALRAGPPVPSASPAAQLRQGATGAPDAVYAMRTPEASPQVGPA